ncbi:MAG: outer membrane protein assembly factor BamA [Myxococcota bacterium]
MAGLSVPEDDFTEAIAARGWAGTLMVLVLFVLLVPTTAFSQVIGPGTDPQPETRDPSQPGEDEALPREVEPREDQTVPEGQPAGEGDVVDVVQVVGNRRVEEASVLEQIDTKSGQPIRPEQISKDIHDVYDLGYFRDVRVDATRTKDGRVVVSFVVVEKPAIARIEYRGNEEIGDDKIKEVVNLKRFSILDVSKVKANAEKIRELYTEKGYYLADVSYKIEPLEERGDLAVVAFDIREYAKVEVKKVTFLGNENIPDDELQQIMRTREGSFLSFLTDFGSFREDQFSEDLQRITAYYYDKGFVQVSVGVPSVRLSRDKKYLYITISIDEGDQFSVGSVDVQGDFIAEKEELMDMVSLSKGDVFSYGTMRRDLQKLQSFYRDSGYAYVNVNPLNRINKPDQSVDVAYDIQKGKKVYFGRIEIAGNTKTRDKVIRRELRIEEGDLFSDTKLQSSKRRIRRLGYFENVEITTQRGARDDLINARVKVTETRTDTFQIGAGFSSTESFIANAQVSLNNLAGRGQSLSLQAQLSAIRSLFNLQFSEPWLFDSPWQFSFNLYNFDYALPDFSRRSTGGDLTFGYPLSRALDLDIPGELLVSATYKLEDVGITTGGRSNRDQETSGAFFRGGLTSSVRLGTFYDNRDNRLFPSDGQYHSVKVELADDTFTLSQTEFLKTDLETRWYFPIFWEFVLRLQGQLGYVTNIDPNKSVPLFERYFVGGPTTVRGFDRFGLGPSRSVALRTTDPTSSLDDFEIGGNKQLIFTAEIEFPIFTAAGIKGVVFADAGNAFDDDQPLTLDLDLFKSPEKNYSDALRTTVGFGFRWRSPIAPLRFEWGIPLQRLPGEKGLVFDFSIGNAF